MKNSVFYAVAAGFFSAAFLFTGSGSRISAIFALFSLIFALIIKLKGRRRFASALVFLLSLSAGWLYCLFFSYMHALPAKMLLAQGAPEIEVRVVAPPVTYTNYASAVVKAKPPVFFLPESKIIFYYSQREYTLSAGDTFLLSGEFSDAREKGSWYMSENISLFCENAVISGLSSAGPSLRYLPARTAAAMRERIDTLYEPQEAGFVRALITGDRTGLDRAYENDLSNSGLSHVISVSGMHLAFLAGLLALLLPKRAAPFVVIPCVWFFSAMTGFPPSIVRSAIMLSFTLAAPLLGREAGPVRSLAISLIAILIANPYAAASLSLILSYLATLGILLFAGKINSFIAKPIPESLKPGLRGLILAISVTLSATILTIPVLALYIGRISLVAPLANFAALWAVEACFILSCLSVAVSFVFPPLANLMAGVVGPLSRYISECAGWFSNLRFSTLGIPSQYSAICLFLIYLLVFVIIKFKSKKPVVALCSLFLVTSAAFAVVFSKDYTQGLVITAIDVGQGQSILVTMNDETYLFDCGSGNQNISAGDIAANHLRRRNIPRIDHLIISHLDIDHYNGVERLLRNTDISNAYLPDEEATAPLSRLLEGSGTDVMIIDESHKISSEIELSMFVETDIWENPMLMSYIKSENFSLLITGDADMGQELLLIYLQLIRNVDLIVVGHHGSDSSTSLDYLNYTLPDYAIISAGRNNRYGHPSPQTLENLEQYKVEVYRTDLRGDITFRVLEGQVEISTSAGN